MASSRPFLELSLTEWLDELAGADVSPAGGSAAALGVAMAAAVLIKCARVSGKGGESAQAASLLARAAPLAQADADAYEAALATREGDWEIGQAFARAAETPLEIARVAADVAELAVEIAGRGDQRIRADAQAAAALAAAGARAAAALVAVNLTAVADDPRVAEAGRLAQAADEACARSHAAD